MNNNNEEKWRYLEYCWKYFELQSRQRNQTCIMYLSLITASITGFFSVLKKGYADWIVYCILALIVIESTAFLFLFNRSTALRQKARNALYKAEDELGIPDQFRYFNLQTTYGNFGIKRKHGEIGKNMYTRVFQLLSIMLIILAFIAMILKHEGII